jgi:hypothetical protein
MTKTILLHIGTPKTGTTSVQQWLARTQRDGTLSPVSYPLWKNDHNQQRVLSLYLPYEDLPPAMRRNFGPSASSYTRMRKRYRNHLFRELRVAGAAVISAESLSGRFSYRDAAQLRDDLESLGFRRFPVVLYVRDPADFFLSATQQLLKSTTTLPFVKDPGSFKYEFLRMTETWEAAFPGQLIVRKYPIGPHPDILEDFATVLEQCLGIAPPPRIPLRANTTLSSEAMQILQDYREIVPSDKSGELTPDAAQVVRFLSQPISGVTQTHPVLKGIIAAQIRANHQADAEVLFSRYGVDLELTHCVPAQTSAISHAHRVDQVIESVDQEVVCQLLLRMVRRELRRSLAQRMTLNIARRSYRRIPSRYRPEALARQLRTHL